MGSGAVPGSALMDTRTGPWRNDDFKAVLEQTGRGVQLHIPTFFNFDENYGYSGAQITPSRYYIPQVVKTLTFRQRP